MDCLAELRALVPLYRRLTAQLGQAEAAAPQRAMLGRLSVALLLWKEIDLRVAELEAERALGSALLANCLGEQVNTDDPELLTRLEMYQEAAAGCAQLADLAPAARDGWLVTLAGDAGDELAEVQHQLVVSVPAPPPPGAELPPADRVVQEALRAQTVDAILGLHRDQLAEELSAPQLPAAARQQLSAQLASVLRQLSQLRAGRGRAAPWAAYSALLSRHLVWLRRADADKLRLEAAPLPPRQLPARRAQLAALSRRLARGRRRLTELRRLTGAGAAGRPPLPLAALERRQANLSPSDHHRITTMSPSPSDMPQT